MLLSGLLLVVVIYGLLLVLCWLTTRLCMFIEVVFGEYVLWVRITDTSLEFVSMWA